MGVEAAGAALAGGAAIAGLHQGRRARKQANAQANAQREASDAQSRRAQAEAQAINTKLEAQRKRIAAGQARSNRSRIRGGIFGEPEQTVRSVSPTLG